MDVLEVSLNRNSIYLLIGAILISIAVTIPRFGDGIPMGVDTTSHLYKILFLQYWWRQGVFPFWSPDWYAGSPALLLYPPLGYYITAGVSLLGLDPLLSYKLVDAVGYWLAPVGVYFLADELGFSKGLNALAALLFSVVPEVVENYIFYDRFPTVIAIPIFCVFIIMFHKFLEEQVSPVYGLGAILTMSALLLTHHLSALIAGIVAVLMVLLMVGKQGLTRPLLKLIFVGVGTAGVTAFWLAPFLMSFDLFSANQFYNRNVTFPFLRFTYFGFDVASYLLGIAQFILAAIGIQSIIGRKFGRRIPMKPMIFFPILLSGMALFQAGEVASSIGLRTLGEVVVAGSFVVFLGQLILSSHVRRILSRVNGSVFLAVWFILFLWLGLGYYALPILQLPYISAIWVKTMDVYRIWLYLALPMSILAAWGFLRSISKLHTWKPLAVVFLLALVIAPISAGLLLKMNYAFNHDVNLVLPYSAANAEIPPMIIHYFQNDPSPGRILAFNVPFWIYVLPNYIGKPIVDGWYPQTKLVTQLVGINDYRLNDLETVANDTVRLNYWQKLVSESNQLDATWVIIGDNGTLADRIMKDAPFSEQLTVPYGKVDLKIYKAIQVPSLVDSGQQPLENVTRPNPDIIILSLKPISSTNTLIVKEAYFPTWAAEADGQTLSVRSQPGTNYIMLQIPADTRQVIIYQKPATNLWNVVSIVSLLTCAGLIAWSLTRRRRRRT
jgi:hypothetical protein